MPLLDHFHPPLSMARHWENLHAQWTGSIAHHLNQKQRLPPGYFAEAQVHVGNRVEVDVATFEEEPPDPSGNGGTATATLTAKVWSPPTVVMEMPAIFPDSVEVLVFSTKAGPTLVAAVELISPGNKDRSEERRGFAAKCASYLQQGIGLVIIDIVTSRQANLHNELVDLLQAGERFLLPAESLYGVSYRPVRRPTVEKIDIWPAAIAVGQPLPLLPLALDRGLCVPLDLEAAYTEACERSRLP